MIGPLRNLAVESVAQKRVIISVAKQTRNPSRMRYNYTGYMHQRELRSIPVSLMCEVGNLFPESDRTNNPYPEKERAKPEYKIEHRPDNITCKRDSALCTIRSLRFENT